MWPFRKNEAPSPAKELIPTMHLRIVGVNRLQQWWHMTDLMGTTVGEWRDVDRVRYGTVD